MKSEIICVGTELLVGDILNTNAKYISEKLAEIGINLYYQTVVGDNHERLKEVLKSAAKRADLVIITGGLGPTIDDITKETIADYYNENLVIVDKYYDILVERYKQMGRTDIPHGGDKEASILENSKLLENRVGIAPGFLYEKNDKIIDVLPGTPSEMTVMVDEELVPILKKYSDELIKFRTLKIIGVPEGNIDEDLADYFKQTNPTVAPYAKTGEVHVRIGVKGINSEKIEEKLDEVENEIRKIYPENIYTSEEKNFYEVLVEILKEKEMTVSTAESVTGGKIADYIIGVSGASKVYKGGFIVYSNEEKEKLLDIDKKVIEKYGAVSEEVCREMLTGLSKKIDTNIYIVSTGVAGPEKDDMNNEVGTVYIGISINGKEYIKKHKFFGDREMIRYRSVRAALVEIWKKVK